MFEGFLYRRFPGVPLSLFLIPLPYSVLCAWELSDSSQLPPLDIAPLGVPRTFFPAGYRPYASLSSSDHHKMTLGGGLVGQDVTAFVPTERLGQVCLPTLERMAAQLSGLDTQRIHVLHVTYPSGSILWRALQMHPEEILRVDLHSRVMQEIRTH